MADAIVDLALVAQDHRQITEIRAVMALKFVFGNLFAVLHLLWLKKPQGALLSDVLSENILNRDSEVLLIPQEVLELLDKQVSCLIIDSNPLKVENILSNKPLHWENSYFLPRFSINILTL